MRISLVLREYEGVLLSTHEGGTVINQGGYQSSRWAVPSLNNILWNDIHRDFSAS